LTERKKNDRKVGGETSLCLLRDICMRQQNAKGEQETVGQD
jgi:hypothetical protein